MAKRKMISDAEAKKLSGKPGAKGKKRQAEIAADAELEDRMSEAQAKKKRPRNELDIDPKAVSGGALRGVMQETIARVYEEIWPGMDVRDKDGDADFEIKEEAYILGITMKVGNDYEKPRKALKIREVENLGDTMQLCERCAA